MYNHTIVLNNHYHGRIVSFRLLLGFQSATTLLSMWISNTATAAMMVPIAMAVIKELNKFKQQSSDLNQYWTELASKDKDKDSDQLVIDDKGKYDEVDSGELDAGTIPPAELKEYKALLLGIAYSSTIGGIGTLIGTQPNIVLAGQLRRSVLSCIVRKYY